MIEKGEQENNNYKKFQKYNAIIGVILGLFPIFMMIIVISFFEIYYIQFLPLIILISLIGLMIGAIQADKKLKQYSKSIFPLLIFLLIIEIILSSNLFVGFYEYNRDNENLHIKEYYGARVYIYYIIENTTIKEINQILSTYNITTGRDNNIVFIRFTNYNEYYNFTDYDERLMSRYYIDEINTSGISIRFKISYCSESKIKENDRRLQEVYESDKRLIKELADIIIEIFHNEYNLQYLDIKYDMFMDYPDIN